MKTSNIRTIDRELTLSEALQLPSQMLITREFKKNVEKNDINAGRYFMGGDVSRGTLKYLIEDGLAQANSVRTNAVLLEKVGLHYNATKNAVLRAMVNRIISMDDKKLYKYIREIDNHHVSIMKGSRMEPIKYYQGSVILTKECMDTLAKACDLLRRVKGVNDDPTQPFKRLPLLINCMLFDEWKRAYIMSLPTEVEHEDDEQEEEVLEVAKDSLDRYRLLQDKSELISSLPEEYRILGEQLFMLGNDYSRTL